MKTTNYFKKIAIAAMGLFAFTANANNLQITGTSVDTTAGEITFSIKWDNSWRTNIAPANHDAVWVFVKYQDCADKLWRHANLSVTSGDHSVGGGVLKVDAVADGKGVFVYRNANGGGNIPFTTVTLKMNVTSPNYDNYNFKVFGVEMVNVPQGAFWIGDGSSYGLGGMSNSYQYNVLSEGNITSTNTGTVVAPPAFPKGFKSFYAMKYEITQEQYVEFLNTLTYNQQSRRTVGSPDAAIGTAAFNGTFRNGIKVKVPGSNSSVPAVYGCNLTGSNDDFDEGNDGQNIAMNWMNWDDFTAYIDWSALRPMTEMEFEKICRGPLVPVAGEYAWGTGALSNFSTIINSGQENEGLGITPANGRANYGATNNLSQQVLYSNPTKVGLTATNASGRETAAATYYGAMEMSGNVGEFTVAIIAAGATYTGVLGDGELSTITATDGDSNQENWPAHGGTLVRGGHFRVTGANQNNSVRLRISDRGQGATGPARFEGYGGRGVR